MLIKFKKESDIHTWISIYIFYLKNKISAVVVVH